MVVMYHLLYVLCFDLLQFFLFFVQSNLQSSPNVNFQLTFIEQHCSIIVRLLFSILILEMYSRYFDPVPSNSVGYLATKYLLSPLSEWLYLAYPPSITPPASSPLQTCLTIKIFTYEYLHYLWVPGWNTTYAISDCSSATVIDSKIVMTFIT
jgi:hypothetical protein